MRNFDCWLPEWFGPLARPKGRQEFDLRSMHTPSRFDRETFQQLLANAFAVQQSQIKSDSLSAVMELQRLIAAGKLDLDGAMRDVVESARNVANATGVAIGLLKGDGLTYRAGSGTSAAYVGQHVTASLTVAADTKTGREILRVENAQTDMRIEAAVCRQFGANSLLILPIYNNGVVAGVLDVRFSEAHTFQDHEVRAYRLMAQQIEAVMLQNAALQPKKNLAPEPSAIPAAEELPLPLEELPAAPEFWMRESSEPSLLERCEAILASARESSAVRKSISLATTITQCAKDFYGRRQRLNLALTAARNSAAFRRSISFARMVPQRARDLHWNRDRRTLALAGVAVILAFSGLVVYGSRRPSPPMESSSAPKSPTVLQPATFPKPVPAEASAAVPRKSRKQPSPTNSGLKRVRVSPNEVDYISEDVTVRVFSDQPAVAKKRAPRKVAHIGNDVTVRYFTPVQSTSRPVGR